MQGTTWSMKLSKRISNEGSWNDWLDKLNYQCLLFRWDNIVKVANEATC